MERRVKFSHISSVLSKHVCMRPLTTSQTFTKPVDFPNLLTFYALEKLLNIIVYARMCAFASAGVFQSCFRIGVYCHILLCSLITLLSKLYLTIFEFSRVYILVLFWYSSD